MTVVDGVMVVLGVSGIVAPAAFALGRTLGARRARRTRRREYGEARALLDITEAVNRSLDLHEVMSLIVQRVGERVGAQRCSIVFVDMALPIPSPAACPRSDPQLPTLALSPKR